MPAAPKHIIIIPPRAMAMDPPRSVEAPLHLVRKIVHLPWRSRKRRARPADSLVSMVMMWWRRPSDRRMHDHGRVHVLGHGLAAARAVQLAAPPRRVCLDQRLTRVAVLVTDPAEAGERGPRGRGHEPACVDGRDGRCGRRACVHVVVHCVGWDAVCWLIRGEVLLGFKVIRVDGRVMSWRHGCMLENIAWAAVGDAVGAAHRHRGILPTCVVWWSWIKIWSRRCWWENGLTGQYSRRPECVTDRPCLRLRGSCSLYGYWYLSLRRGFGHDLCPLDPLRWRIGPSPRRRAPSTWGCRRTRALGSRQGVDRARIARHNHCWRRSRGRRQKLRSRCPTVSRRRLRDGRARVQGKCP
jgi:hypothetical protein